MKLHSKGAIIVVLVGISKATVNLELRDLIPDGFPDRRVACYTAFALCSLIHEAVSWLREEKTSLYIPSRVVSTPLGKLPCGVESAKSSFHKDSH